MKSKTIYQILTLILVSSVFLSCQKEKLDIDLESNRWRVVKLKLNDNSSFKRADDTYFLEFLSDTSFLLILDVNGCYLNYESIQHGNIEVTSGLFCTKVCCDSDYAEKIKKLMPLMTKYYGKGKKLFFEGEGKIVLEPDNNS